MTEDSYIKLCERLNENAVKLPPIESVLNFLRDLVTEEQAEVGAQMPLGVITLKNLAKIVNRDEAELKDILEPMADEGVVFVGKNENNEDEYGLIPFAPGIFELQYLKGEEDEKARRRNHLIGLIHKELEGMTGELYKNVEVANQQLGQPGLRTLAVEEELPSNTEIAGWERISDIMAKENSFAVGTCTCRQAAKLDGNPCKIKDVPLETCVFFGKSADFIVDRNFGRRLTREELIDLLKSFEKFGLIHNINNTMGDNIVLCNCCGCCCDILSPMVKYRGLNRVAKSNFVAVVDEESCVGCGECVELCQIKAIELVDDKAVINADYCMGCGCCVSICPTESVKLERTDNYKPPKQDERLVGFGI